MRLKSVMLIGIIILSGAVLSFAQSDDNAKNLYYGYEPKKERSQRRTTTANSNRTNIKRRGNVKRNRANANSASTGETGSNGILPAPTGFPGTKIMIELMRNDRRLFVSQTFNFRSGDKIRLRMQTNFEGYVTVLNLGSTGRINLLYPVQGLDNYVMPTVDYQIPNGNGWIIFDNKPGIEIISVIMSENKIEGLGSLNSDSDYFRNDRTGKDLLTQNSDNSFYAVFREQEGNVGFTLKLKHD